MDTTPKVMEFIDATYEDAADEGKEKVIIIPTSPILLPINPVQVAQKFSFLPMLAVCTLADALCEVYTKPEDPSILRALVEELTALADRMEAAQSVKEPQNG